MHTDGNFKELVDLLKENKQFAMLCPIGIISQLSRRENRENNQWSYDKEIDQLVIGLSKLVLSHDNQVWLINLNNHPRFVEVLSTENVGCSLDQAITTCCDALCHLVMEQQPLPDWDTHNYEVSENYNHIITSHGMIKIYSPTTTVVRNAPMHHRKDIKCT